MKTSKLLFSLIIVLLSIEVSLSQDTVMYKKLDSLDLFLEVYSPSVKNSSKPQSAIIFFFGGGWNGGNRSQFLEHAKYLSKRGMVCFLADYRTRKSHATTPFESVKDAKSSIRFLRQNATKFNIDPDRIVASGGSAGGHLAAATAFIEDYNDPTDDLSIDPKPNALVLFNPVIDNGPGGYGYERIGDEYHQFSPLHNIEKGAPPSIIFLGTNDRLIPVSTMEYYKTVMEKVGSRCDLHLFEGEKHGFFNYKNFEMYETTVSKMNTFLTSIDYLAVEPKVKIE